MNGKQQHIPGLEPQKRKKVYIPKGRGQDVIFDAIWDVCYGPNPLTRTQKGLVAKVAHELREAFGNQVTPIEIGKRWAKITREFKHCTPRALTVHWHEFGPKRERVNPEEEAKRKAYLEDVRERNAYIKSLSDAEFADLHARMYDWLEQKRLTSPAHETRYFPALSQIRTCSRESESLVDLLWWREKKRRRMSVWEQGANAPPMPGSAGDPRFYEDGE